MSWRSSISRESYRIGTISDSSMIGKIENTTGSASYPSCLRVLEALCKDPGRNLFGSPWRPEIKFVGTITSDDSFFHESTCGRHNCLGGRTAEDFINGTNGATTLSTLYTAVGPAFPLTHLIIELGGNDIGVLGRTPAVACASVATLVATSKSLSPTTRVVIFPPHAVINGPNILTLQALQLDPAQTGGDIIVTGVTGYTSAMMVAPLTDPHPKVRANGDLIGTWRQAMDPANYGSEAMGMWLFDALFPGYPHPLRAGESWAA